jgi:hypothetical protein
LYTLLAEPPMNDVTYRCHISTRPVAMSRPTASALTAFTPVATPASQRRSMRSAIAPANGEMKRMLIPRRNCTKPSWNGESVSSWTSQPWPIASIQLANPLAMVPETRSRKLAFRRVSNGPAIGAAATAASTGVMCSPGSALDMPAAS